jgi:choline dehydrogenase-like flavoprotein
MLGHAGEFVECNIADCLGCGYCNIGCAYGKKLSMLDVTLPRAQAKHGKDALRIIAECRVDKIVHSNSVAREVRCTLSDGSSLSIRAAEVVVAAGAIASSAILARSGIGGKLVGRELGFNIATPLVCDFDEALHPERGLQISHWLESAEGGFALETWGQPIVSMSLFMPGWFAEHERNMRRYPHMACVGSVVGSESTAVVKPARNPRAVKLQYTPSKADLAKLTEGMKLAGRIMLAAGARRVMPSSLAFHEYNTPAELERLPADVSRPGGLSVNTAHPQGGNRLSSDSRNGVVAPDFRVHGMQNVWVCDASVFPTTITVNPQLTVMALATYAAGEMA